MLQQAKKFNVLVEIRERYTQRARKNLLKARCELEQAQLILSEISDKISAIEQSTKKTTNTAYSGSCLPLREILIAQTHLHGLREELLSEKNYQEEAAIKVENVKKEQANKFHHYKKMKCKQDNAEAQRYKYLKVIDRKNVASEEEMANEQWQIRPDSIANK